MQIKLIPDIMEDGEEGFYSLEEDEEVEIEVQPKTSNTKAEVKFLKDDALFNDLISNFELMNGNKECEEEFSISQTEGFSKAVEQQDLTRGELQEISPKKIVKDVPKPEVVAVEKELILHSSRLNVTNNNLPQQVSVQITPSDNIPVRSAPSSYTVSSSTSSTYAIPIPVDNVEKSPIPIRYATSAISSSNPYVSSSHDNSIPYVSSSDSSPSQTSSAKSAAAISSDYVKSQPSDSAYCYAY